MRREDFRARRSEGGGRVFLTIASQAYGPFSFHAENDEFRVALLTPLGRSAISVIGVSGFQAPMSLRSCWTCSDGGRSSLFDGEWSPEVASRPFFGLFHFQELDNVADEVVLRWRTPTAFELDCHGGLFVAERLIDFFLEAGATRVSGAEWEQIVVKVERELSGVARRSPSDSVFDVLFFDAADELVAQTTTETTAKLALAQPKAWREWFKLLAQTVALGDVQSVVAALDAVLNESLGRRLVAPFVVALCGSPNVGKSSLLNAILGYKRALATPFPGTTLDLVGAPFAYGGWNFLFVDTAGFRETDVALERMGIDLAQKGLADADLVLCVYDPTFSRVEQERIFQRFVHSSELGARQDFLETLNKCDLGAEFWSSDWNETTTLGMTRVSAREGIGLTKLLAAVFRATVLRKSGLDEFEFCPKPLLWSDDQASYLRRLRELALCGNLGEVAVMLEPLRV